jgi:hypothetical protein
MVLRHPTREYQSDRASRTARRTATRPADHTPTTTTQRKMRKISHPHLTNRSPYQMSSATGSGGVAGEGAAGTAESVVEGDCGCERHEACGEPDAEVLEGAGAVAFEGEDVFGSPVDRFDTLADQATCGPRPGSSLRRGRAIWASSASRSASNCLPRGSSCRRSWIVAFVALLGAAAAAADARPSVSTPSLRSGVDFHSVEPLGNGLLLSGGEISGPNCDWLVVDQDLGVESPIPSGSCERPPIAAQPVVPVQFPVARIRLDGPGVPGGPFRALLR